MITPTALTPPYHQQDFFDVNLTICDNNHVLDFLLKFICSIVGMEIFPRRYLWFSK